MSVYFSITTGEMTPICFSMKITITIVWYKFYMIIWIVWNMCFIHMKICTFWTSKCKNSTKNRDMVKWCHGLSRNIFPRNVTMWRLGIHNVCVFWLTIPFKGGFRGSKSGIGHGISILTSSNHFFFMYPESSRYRTQNGSFRICEVRVGQN